MNDEERNVRAKAFIGVSLDGSHFSREWVRSTLDRLSADYKQVLILFADDVLKFTRTAVIKRDSIELDFVRADSQVLSRYQETKRFFESELKFISRGKSNRTVEFSRWRDWTDSDFNDLHRKLRIAYETIPFFHFSVDEVAQRHLSSQKGLGLDSEVLLNLNVGYILEESAMCLRMTEIEGYSDEYHPVSDLPLMPELYSGAFSEFGLTVEALTGSPARRHFHVLEMHHESA
jgi:tRNA-dependent cyclodipeptide synthase